MELNNIKKLEVELFNARRSDCHDIVQRADFVLTAARRTHGFYASLTMKTGIESKRWRNFASGAQRPTPDMIEALAKLFPDYAFWLVTGILPTDDVLHCVPEHADFVESNQINITDAMIDAAREKSSSIDASTIRRLLETCLPYSSQSLKAAKLIVPTLKNSIIVQILSAATSVME
ncbi:hypothetical protein ACO0LB_17810 [Undibacterium sp. SXout7W]|uniref:hypothetical protein n=1 Tax=Undibacterium sp. SXout7W TaxID=3413049 RepID=UPI003BF3C3BB